MQRYEVFFAPAALEHLAVLYQRIATAASPAIAERYSAALLERCVALGIFPERGTPRDDIRPGLRITSYRKRTVIAFTIEADLVAIVGVFHGGQDYEADLELSETA